MSIRLILSVLCFSLAGCSLVTVPVKTAGSIVTSTVKTTGDIVTAPFDAAGRIQAAPDSKPPPAEDNQKAVRPVPTYYLEEARPVPPVAR